MNKPTTLEEFRSMGGKAKTEAQQEARRRNAAIARQSAPKASAERMAELRAMRGKKKQESVDKDKS